VALISWVLLILFTFTHLFDYVFNYIVIFGIAFWITSFAAILLPYRRKELFEAAPAMVQAKIAGVPWVTIAGCQPDPHLPHPVLHSSYSAFSGLVDKSHSL
jgi:hypothetical protein